MCRCPNHFIPPARSRRWFPPLDESNSHNWDDTFSTSFYSGVRSRAQGVGCEKVGNHRDGSDLGAFGNELSRFFEDSFGSQTGDSKTHAPFRNANVVPIRKVTGELGSQ